MSSIDRNKLTILLNVIALVGVLVALNLGKVTWEQAIAGLSLLLVPSVAQAPKVDP
jgi:hypothetical protein